MATSVDKSPADQSDAPQGNSATGPRRRVWPGVLVGLFLVFAIGVAVTPVVVDLTPPPQNGELTWPYLSATPEWENLAGPSAEAPVPTAEGLAAVLDPLMSDVAGTWGVSVRDGLTGEELFGVAAQQPLVPASSTKTITGAAALAAWGGGYRIPTRVVAGSAEGEVVLVAGGDVTLTRDGQGYYDGAAQLSDLAEQVLDALGDTAPTTLVVDTSIFADDQVAHGVDPDDVTAGYTARLTPLMVDGGRLSPSAANSPSPRSGDPTEFAARQLAELLGGPTVVRGTADAAAAELGVVYSPTMQRLVEYANISSDNVLTDALARQVALARDHEASFAGGAAATIQIMAELGVPTDGMLLYDGSGLSNDNKLTAASLSAVVSLVVSGSEPRLSGLSAALPVAGHSGSLDYRFDENDNAHGEVRAKTGTLAGVSSLTGMVLNADGRWLTFSLILNDRGDLQAAQDGLDAAAAALVECGCR